MYDLIIPIFEYISTHSFLGVGLDIPAHLAVGAILFIVLERIIDFQKALFIVFIIAVLKEVHDQAIMTNTLVENIKDIFNTLIIPVALIMRTKFVRPLESRQ